MADNPIQREILPIPPARTAGSSPTTPRTRSRSGTATLFVDGKKAGEGRVEATAAMVFSADDGLDVGRDTGGPVSPDYGAQGDAFSGFIRGGQLAIAKDAEAPGHEVDPARALAMAMARQ